MSTAANLGHMDERGAAISTITGNLVRADKFDLDIFLNIFIKYIFMIYQINNETINLNFNIQAITINIKID